MIVETDRKLLGTNLEKNDITGTISDVQFLNIPENNTQLPIYDFRNLEHQVHVAKVLARGGQILMYAGVWGVFKGVKRATRNETFFMRAKPGRPPEAKIPVMLLPQEATKIIDWSNVHPDFRFLQDYWNFKNLWSHGAFLHIIAPVRHTLEALPEIFKTSPEEFQRRYPNQEPIPSTTVAVLWHEEPYKRHFSSLVKRYSHTDTFIGASTNNEHGRKPYYTSEELFESIQAEHSNLPQLDLICTDKKYEESGVFASHTQLRLPLIGESPTLKVLRIGSVSLARVEEATGLECEIPSSGVKDVRKDTNLNLDTMINRLKLEIDEMWRHEKPVIFYRD